MDVITTYLHLPITDPTWIFIIVLSIILFAPMIFSKLRIPHLVGMILAGVLIGEHGVNLLERDSSFELFGKVGIYFIMFLAGLEMDMQNLKRNYTRGFIFGLITTLLPFAFGMIAGLFFLHYSMAASLLLSCILASHTLVSYTITSRYGVQKDVSVSISVVATMFALLSALLLLAGISGVVQGHGGPVYWGVFCLKLCVFIVFMYLGLPEVIRFFFRRYTEPIMQFTFTLAIVFLSAAVAELCGLEGIFGAFLSGLVLNRFIPFSSPLMNRLEFVGNALFIPYFLIGIGMLVNVSPLFHEGKAVAVVAIMVIAGTVSKLISAFMTQKLFHFTRSQGMMMFGLTEAHAAGALAVVMVGTRLEIEPGVPLMNNAVLDGVVMMILISCLISSVATDRAGKMLKFDTLQLKATSKEHRSDSTPMDDEKILIPISEPLNIRTLMNLAFMMRNKQLKRGVICLNIINDADMSEKVQAHSKECLRIAHRVAAAADVPLQTQSRLAVNFVTATVHSMRENDASEILIGLHRPKGDEAPVTGKRKASVSFSSYFGMYGNGLIEGMSRQLMILRLVVPLNLINKLVVAVPEKAEYEKGFTRWINRVARMATDIGCAIEFHAHSATCGIIRQYLEARHPNVSSLYIVMNDWAELTSLADTVTDTQLLIVVTARRGALSYQKAFARLPEQLAGDFARSNLLIVFPDQKKASSEPLSIINNAV